MAIITAAKDFIFRRPIISLVVLLIFVEILSKIEESSTQFLQPNPMLSFFSIFLVIASGILSVLLIVRIILVYLIKRPLDQLFSSRNLASLLFSYAIFILGVLLLISFLYMEIVRYNLGYLTYGHCSDTFTPDLITKDPSISHDYFYFAAVTFFTIGYGDICPMGSAKMLSVLTVFLGNVVNVVLMGIVVALYLSRKNISKA